MTTDNDLSQNLDNIPSMININITCQSGSSLILTNNFSVPENEEEIEVTENLTNTQTTQNQTTQNQTTQNQTTQNMQYTPVNTNTPPGLLPSNSRMFLAVNPISTTNATANSTTNNSNQTQNQNISSITQNLLNSIISGIGTGANNGTNTITESITFIPSTQNVQQMHPPADGLSLNDLRNYTTLCTHTNSNTNTESQNDSEVKCEICHDVINNGEIVRMINICNHSFHQECVDSWFENNKICPYCRCDVEDVIPGELANNSANDAN
jgi:hypothetical protein